MEGRAREGAVRLFDDDDIDRTGESRGIDLVVEEAEVADDLGDIVHAVHGLSPRTTGRGTRSTTGREHDQRSAVRNSRRGERETYSRLSSVRRSPACERERDRDGTSRGEERSEIIPRSANLCGVATTRRRLRDPLRAR